MNPTIRPAHPKLKILYKKARYKVLYGGRSSTKSWGAAEAIVHYALNHRVRILCAREIQKSIEQSSYQLLIDTISRLCVSKYFYVIKNKILCTATGATFQFHGLSQVTEDSIKSMEGIDIVWLEEGQNISKCSLDILIPTIRKRGSEIWITFNPHLSTDAVWQMFCTGNPPEGTLIEKINYTDVTHVLSQDVIDEAERLKEDDEARYRHIWLGELDESVDDAIITQQMIDEAKAIEPDVVRSAPVIAGLDVARYGDDRSCLYMRKGLFTVAIKVYKHLKGPELKEKVVNECVRNGVNKLIIDVNGVGDFLQDDFAVLLPNVDVIEFRGSFAASSSDFKNVRVECWWRIREALAEGLRLAYEPTLIGQLLSQKYFYNTRGQKQMPDKQKLRAEGIQSPDIGDALSMTFFGQKDGSAKDTINAMIRG